MGKLRPIPRGTTETRSLVFVIFSLRGFAYAPTSRLRVKTPGGGTERLRFLSCERQEALFRQGAWAQPLTFGTEAFVASEVVSPPSALVPVAFDNCVLGGQGTSAPDANESSMQSFEELQSRWRSTTGLEITLRLQTQLDPASEQYVLQIALLNPSLSSAGSAAHDQMVLEVVDGTDDAERVAARSPDLRTYALASEMKITRWSYSTSYTSAWNSLVLEFQPVTAVAERQAEAVGFLLLAPPTFVFTARSCEDLVLQRNLMTEDLLTGQLNSRPLFLEVVVSEWLCEGSYYQHQLTIFLPPLVGFRTDLRYRVEVAVRNPPLPLDADLLTRALREKTSPKFSTRSPLLAAALNVWRVSTFVWAAGDTGIGDVPFAVGGGKLGGHLDLPVIHGFPMLSLTRTAASMANDVNLEAKKHETQAVDEKRRPPAAKEFTTIHKQSGSSAEYRLSRSACLQAMALPMREDVDSLKVFRSLLEKERLLSTRWNKQVDYSAWRIPSHSHHESFLKPGDGVRLTVSRSHPELNGASGTVLCVDRPSDGGLVTCSSQERVEEKPSRFLRCLFAMAGVKIQVKLAGTTEVPKNFHHGKAQHKEVQSLPSHSRHLPEPHGLSEFLSQAHRMAAFEWPKALEERHLEAQQLRLVIEDSDTYSYEALLQQGFLPKFLCSELRCRNCATVRLAAQNPMFVRRSGSWIIRPNPSYFDYVQAAKAPRDLKFQPQGFRLIAWWVHPNLQRDSPWFQPNEIIPCEPGADHTFDYRAVQPLSDFQTSAVKYLMTWRDLDPEHRAELIQLRADIFDHLAEVGGFYYYYYYYFKLQKGKGL
ncbi:unnamed protein product [Symbiodinium sp. KB8]|nr:unnamed protein product [Symbiodinium sp. KB8]